MQWLKRSRTSENVRAYTAYRVRYPTDANYNIVTHQKVHLVLKGKNDQVKELPSTY